MLVSQKRGLLGRFPVLQSSFSKCLVGLEQYFHMASSKTITKMKNCWEIHGFINFDCCDGKYFFRGPNSS